MRPIESEAKRKRKNRNFKKIILTTVAAAGLLSVALVAPNTLQAIEKMGFLPKPRDREIIKRSRSTLIKKGLLQSKDGFLRLTPKGESFIQRLEMADFKIKRPKKWDGQWRVLIFDIPEKRRALRDKIRITLVAIGFARLQHSVWIYPYDCEELVTLLKADFKIGKDLLYMVVDSLENDGWIRSYFGLPIN